MSELNITDNMRLSLAQSFITKAYTCVADDIKLQKKIREHVSLANEILKNSKDDESCAIILSASYVLMKSACGESEHIS